MDDDQVFDSIEDVFSDFPEEFNILEEEVNIETQREFYEASKDIGMSSGENEEVNKLIARLKRKRISEKNLRETLLQLSMCDTVEAYRAIENYNSTAEGRLKEWSTLALQQSRMLMHSSLLGQQQIFISTGLGGKKGKLRYFLIFPYLKRRTAEPSQQSILEKEIMFFLNKYEGELEEINHYAEFTTATALLPLKAPLGNIIQDIIEECNQYGNYLSYDVLVTNLKKLNNEEINNFITDNENDNR